MLLRLLHNSDSPVLTVQRLCFSPLIPICGTLTKPKQLFCQYPPGSRKMSLPNIRFSNITCLTKVISFWLYLWEIPIPLFSAAILIGTKHGAWDFKKISKYPGFQLPFMLESKFVNCQLDLIFPLYLHLFAVVRIPSPPPGFTHLQHVAGKKKGIRIVLVDFSKRIFFQQVCYQFCLLK